MAERSARQPVASASPQPARRIANICVYCGSGPGLNPAYLQAANFLGHAMAERGIGLVYGGGSLGLMGEVARGVLAGGGRVTGIIPQFLSDKERMLREVQELIVVDDMHQRKKLMFERSDAFVALPGGIGTLEELVEQLTWAQLGRHISRSYSPTLRVSGSHSWRCLGICGMKHSFARGLRCDLSRSTMPKTLYQRRKPQPAWTLRMRRA